MTMHENLHTYLQSWGIYKGDYHTSLSGYLLLHSLTEPMQALKNYSFNSNWLVHLWRNTQIEREREREREQENKLHFTVTFLQQRLIPTEDIQRQTNVESTLYQPWSATMHFISMKKTYVLTRNFETKYFLFLFHEYIKYLCHFLLQWSI